MCSLQEHIEREARARAAAQQELEAKLRGPGTLLSPEKIAEREAGAARIFQYEPIED